MPNALRRSRPFPSPLVAASVLALVFSGGARADDGLILLPAEARLETGEGAQRLLLQEKRADGEIGAAVSKDVEWSSSVPEVAAVVDGLVAPKGDGEAVVTARFGGRTATARVVVSGVGRAVERSFRNDVEPILAKMGCNTGACHGALAGKGGFRLSLNGFDPAADFFNLVKADRGRRVELSDPGRSLALAKPSGAIPHKGGLRFTTDSREYRIFADWIAAGAPPPADSDRRVEAVEVLPAGSLHKVGDVQPILVLARYDDGRTEDVTRWAKWSSADESVCRVDGQGAAAAVGPGEGAVVAWYASKIAIARITVPYANEPSPSVAEAVDRRKPRNFIDEFIDKQLTRLNLPASPRCDDAAFVRRAWIDAVGRPPTVAEVREFLSDPSPAKRDALVDELLKRPEFVDYWTYKWSDVLMLTSAKLRPDSVKSYYQWIHKNVEANAPWDRMVREILTATGESQDNGATNFYGLSQSPEEMTENASQAFLGLSISCARCHNHPLEKWTNDQYFAMANLFARVRAKGWGGNPSGGDGRRTLYVARSGDLIQPRTGKPQPPAPLDGAPSPIDDPADRRERLADWMTSADNPYFARAIANRVWANYFGVGLVEKIDDVRVSNPASNEALLQAAADHLVKNRFDLKALMKAILQSNAYQRSSRPLPGNKGDRRFYSRYYPRRMMAEVLLDAITQVTQAPSKFENVLVPGGSRVKTDFYPPGTRAIQLYDSSVENYFLQAFGRNSRRIVCECERSAEPSVVQVLHLTNGDTINKKLSARDNWIGRLLALRRQGMSDPALFDEIYLAALARYPAPAEREALLAMLPPPGASDERSVVEDVFWGLLSSREFLFNH